MNLNNNISRIDHNIVLIQLNPMILFIIYLLYPSRRRPCILVNSKPVTNQISKRIKNEINKTISIISVLNTIRIPVNNSSNITGTTMIEIDLVWKA